LGKGLQKLHPDEDINLANIEAYLLSLDPPNRQRVLNKNPSYVFFKEIKTPPMTTLGIPVTPGRILATDLEFFPKGALAYLTFPGPPFESEKNYSRLVIDADTGGAVKGGGHADLFWGTGEVAKKYAGAMKSRARLYYLAPKKDFLATLPNDHVMDSH
jgi:membrane-bound lytic murein transglycosylase A